MVGGGSKEINRFQATQEKPTVVTEVTLPTNTKSSHPDDINTCFTNFFNDPYRQDPTELDESSLLEGIASLGGRLPQVDKEEGDNILCPTTNEELFDILKNIKSGSSPGPDGLPTEFYRTFWHITGNQIVQLVNDILTTSSIPPSFRKGRLVLLHKEGKDPSLTSSYRPITVLNSDYKLFVSLLVSRIKWVWPDLICPQQPSSVSGRNIVSATNLTCDLFRYTNITGNTGVFLSLDQQNALDRVSHMYLYSVLKAYGFLQSL